MSVAGRLSFRKLPIYWAAQTLGSFLASALCFAIYKGMNKIHSFDMRKYHTIDTISSGFRTVLTSVQKR